MRTIRMLSLATAIVAIGAATASAQSYGSLKGRFVLDGKAPTPKKLVVDKDPAVCAAPGVNLVDESLVVGETGGIANVVVSLFLKPTDKKPAIHPSFAETIKTPAEFDNLQCRFEPRMALLFTGQELVLKNSDPIGHNVKANMLSNPAFNDLIPGGAQLVKKPVKSAERLPVEASCSIHPWMRGYLVVLDHPYGAITDKDGNFEIKHVPSGKWTFRVWQERAGYVQEVKMGGKVVKWTRGQFEVDIAADKEYDLGEVLVGLDKFPVK